jgi:hypothetical protein
MLDKIYIMPAKTGISVFENTLRRIRIMERLTPGKDRVTAGKDREINNVKEINV